MLQSAIDKGNIRRCCSDQYQERVPYLKALADRTLPKMSRCPKHRVSALERRQVITSRMAIPQVHLKWVCAGSIKAMNGEGERGLTDVLCDPARSIYFDTRLYQSRQPALRTAIDLAMIG